MTPELAEAEQTVAAAIFVGWIHDAHGAARKRNPVAFREAADLHELWKWLWSNRWGAAT